MNRKLFLRNALMTLAIAFVPKILQPIVPEIMEEQIPVTTYKYTYNDWDNPTKSEYVMFVSKEFKDNFEKLIAERQFT